ncbi:uncharacterized protein (TIGR00290 family) [Chitinophaga skermanii]|uniref:Uncharacterized protein (TIGR00290 family) n=1 Tax=Chitinophaga skermanii TaxID=331697 RepID=A0A327QJZ8_9BACT|nr:diphthine--ammonia ligase [Chitinophaga skermanii]RAJ04014.1 uncharacterized protein (TIGR00290 family) [Chitinophaga skermanii]
MQRAFLNWSGGKDASFALWHMQQQQQYKVSYLFTTLSQAYKRVSMHGVREELLDAQAASIGIPLVKAYLPENASMEDYNHIMTNTLTGLQAQGISNAVFGDIFLEDLRKYRETQLAQIGMQGIFPLWQKNTRQLVLDFNAAGFKTVIVCTNAKYLDASFAGRVLDEQCLADFPPNVDPCGENGEFHTFVYDGPIFSTPIDFQLGETVTRYYEPARNEDDCYKKDAEKDWDTAFFYRDLLPV